MSGALIRMSSLAGNRATTQAVQRTVLVAEQRWLERLLASRDAAAINAELAAGATMRILSMPDGDCHDTVAAVRGEIDAFEVAFGTTIGFGHSGNNLLLAGLEGAQANDALGTRLVTLFNASVHPQIGLALIDGINESRVRACLQGNAGGASAITTLLTRNPPAGLPGTLATARSYLERLRGEMASPTTEGLTASTPGREAAVESLLTPPAVHQARAAAAAAGAPPPAFIEAGYYDGLMTALHAAAEGHWPSSNAMNSRASMDTATGGHVEGIATEAKRRVDALFGAYGSAGTPSLTFASGNLVDQTTTAGDPFDLARWYIEDSGDSGIEAVKNAHNAFADARANVIGRDVMTHYSNNGGPTSIALPADLDTRLTVNAAERVRRLTIIDRMWPGMAAGGTVRIRARVGANAHDTRRQYWGLFKTLIHEYLHTTANPTYTTWYGGLTDPHQTIVYQEGFTDLFTLKTWRSVFPDHVSASPSFRQAVQGTTTLDLPAVGGDPGHYPEMAEAQALETMIGLPNMRAAYFRGNTAVLGGGRLPR